MLLSLKNRERALLILFIKTKQTEVNKETEIITETIPSLATQVKMLWGNCSEDNQVRSTSLVLLEPELNDATLQCKILREYQEGGHWMKT